MRVGRDQQPVGVHPPRVEATELGEQHTGVDHDTVADDVGDPRGQNSRGDEVQREILTAGQDNGVPGVVAALIAHNPLHPPTE